VRYFGKNGEVKSIVSSTKGAPVTALLKGGILSMPAHPKFSLLSVTAGVESQVQTCLPQQSCFKYILLLKFAFVFGLCDKVCVSEFHCGVGACVTRCV
jgi:hypothetical protein